MSREAALAMAVAMGAAAYLAIRGGGLLVDTEGLPGATPADPFAGFDVVSLDAPESGGGFVLDASGYFDLASPAAAVTGWLEDAQSLAGLDVTDETGDFGGTDLSGMDLGGGLFQESLSLGDLALRTAAAFGFRSPVDGARMSSPFGWRQHPILGTSKMHTGVDWAAPAGTPVYAINAGTVARAGYFGSAGNMVEVKHSGGLMSRAMHLSKLLVAPGATVSKGQLIGFVGSTGRYKDGRPSSTGPHLHFETLRDGKHINPLEVLKNGS